jgi:curved DNA-binding protein CbpA
MDNSHIDHYAVLGIPFGATPHEIKQQYNKMALKYHPDKNNGDKSIFIQIQESYEALKDVESRREYDLIWRRKKELLEREAKLRDRQAQLQQECEKERQRQQREREAQLQQERQKEQCHQCEWLKRKQEMDGHLSKKVVEEFKKQVETLKCQLAESKKEVETLKCQIVECKNEHVAWQKQFKNEHVAWQKQFWKLHEKYEALQQKNMEMHGEIPDAEIQREAKRQRKADEPDGCREDITTDKPECCREDITAKLLQICANGVRHNTDAVGIEWYSLTDFLNHVCSGKDKKAVNRTWEYFRDRSKFKDEIDKLTRRQNGTPTVNISGLERMLTILDKKHIGTDFYNLVDKIKFFSGV